MELIKKYRLRIENCVGTIIDVHKIVGDTFGGNELLQQFESLKEAVRDLDMDLICEGDVLMVENATNTLLSEFRPVFEKGELGPVYGQKVN